MSESRFINEAGRVCACAALADAANNKSSERASAASPTKQKRASLIFVTSIQIMRLRSAQIYLRRLPLSQVSSGGGGGGAGQLHADNNSVDTNRKCDAPTTTVQAVAASAVRTEVPTHCPLPTGHRALSTHHYSIYLSALLAFHFQPRVSRGERTSPMYRGTLLACVWPRSVCADTTTRGQLTGAVLFSANTQATQARTSMSTPRHLQISRVALHEGDYYPTTVATCSNSPDPSGGVS
ncbi:hypothetical protein SFRURICE_015768 [Spodoptera frugiperda]|nr:hypothetical protein SFRURICE_015768 [Spodoptera frugiperda]